MSDANTVISKILLIGVVASLTLVLFGSALFMIHPVAGGQRGISGLIDGIRKMQPDAIINLGILVLLLTPAARVIGAGVSFAMERDYRYVFISAIVLAVMTAAAIVGVKLKIAADEDSHYRL